MEDTAERLLIDTDVLIDYLRDKVEAVSYLESLSELLLISVITVAELYAGVRDGAERIKLDEFIAATAEIHQARLVTLNGKHFPMLMNVIIPYQKIYRRDGIE